MSPVPNQVPLLTGAAAAAQLGLEGFVDRAWPALWCGPTSLRPGGHLIRTAKPIVSFRVGELTIAHPALVLRHIGNQAEPIGELDDLSVRDRVEIAVEHALRTGLVTINELTNSKSRSPGDRLLREIMCLRGEQPPAESYAEVRALQLLRSWDFTCWRQVPIYERGRIVNRVDVVVPFDQRATAPEILSPSDGVLLEVDSRRFHEREFEKDHARQTTYDVLGFSWTTFTPTQFETQPDRVRRAFETLFAAARRRQKTASRNTQKRSRNSQARKSA